MIFSDHYPFQNCPLPYAYDALEPYIDAKTMELHHDRHLQTYIDNLNFVLKDQPILQSMPLNQLIVTAQQMRVAVGRPILRNAGGVYNHQYFFEALQPHDPNNAPAGELLKAILDGYGSVEDMKQRFKAAALSVFGSGYAWLVTDKNANIGMIITVNQETPLPTELCPLLNLDLWEHAYYLKNYNDRAAYIDNWFNVVNWAKVEERFLACPYFDFDVPIDITDS